MSVAYGVISISEACDVISITQVYCAISMSEELGIVLMLNSTTVELFYKLIQTYNLDTPQNI